MKLKSDYRESLLSLYVGILDFQATAVCHFARNTLLRTIRSTLQLEDWAKLLKDVKAKDLTCKEYTDIFISQDQRAGMLLLQEALEQNDSKLHDILDLLRSSQEDNLRILMWYSDITYGSDHDQYGQLLGLAMQTRGSGYYHVWTNGFSLVTHR